MHRGWLYVAALVAIVALVVGIGAGAFNLVWQQQRATGNETSYSGTVTGLSYTSTVAGILVAPVPAASTGSTLAPQSLAPGANVFCATTCTAAHRALNVTYSFSTSMAGSISVTVKVTTSGSSGTTTIYLRQSLFPTSGSIEVVWDVGAAASPLSLVTVTVHQCTGLLGTCP
ncbi:MAG TPA: hypothetical protein VGV89_07895 [Thermoplasmata archaeon]|nr:hypothetical protein [Thermoplasmata archaeon]